MKTSEPGKYYDSDTFMVGATPMAIRVYPNGYYDKYKGNVSVFLFNQSGAALTVKFITEAKTWSFNNEVRAKRGWGLFALFSHAQCADLYKEKDFVVTAIVEVHGEDLKIMGNDDAFVPTKHCVCKNLFDQMMDPNFSLVFQGAEVLPQTCPGRSLSCL